MEPVGRSQARRALCVFDASHPTAADGRSNPSRVCAAPLGQAAAAAAAKSGLADAADAEEDDDAVAPTPAERVALAGPATARGGYGRLK